MSLSLVIVHDLNIDRTRRTFPPLETNPPLVIDADAVLAFPIPEQCLEAVAGKGGEVLQRPGRLETIKHQLGGPLDSRERLDPLAGREFPGPLVPVADDHCSS